MTDPRHAVHRLGPRADALLRRARAVVPPALDLLTPVFVVRAEGARLWDADGHVYLDLSGGVGCLNVGHSHPKVVAAITEQARRFIHTDFTVAPYEAYVAVAERLVALAPGAGPRRAALFNSGAEAVENAVKVARAATGRPALIAFEGAFHGRTYLALSLTSRVDPYKRRLGPFMPEVYRAPYPDPYRTPSADPTAYVMDHLERMLVAQVAPDAVAAVIVEPVLGEGGFVVPPPDFLPALRALCDRHGILLIVDEIQTGFGRTGRMFAVEHSGVTPDLLVVGKSLAAGMPLSAVVGRADLFDQAPPGALGGTYVGNPVACAAALAVLEVIEEERLVERARRLGEVLEARLAAWAARYPLVGHARGLGAMRAVELVHDRTTRAPAPDATAAVLREALARGVLALRAGLYGNVIRFLMPLVIAEEDLQRALDILEEALAKVQQTARPARLSAGAAE
ncbi:MAG: 4-aminobutyrate--2-oxoglutarate transaminase [Armatimonadota bacterium]|nr:4-aminobutyrate--2-oxoglutarate transaminase [Armatimonadota bacterium]MDR7448109.1 4-aminobutyrate--2-oxoglutarate transaminase [Armatimonadota bacterium]MDR7459687.1 4-aminobutyrate--2-oxoglutarate transaminase [Armatimonadota bacterium]MDR7478279.1 4-aminobutyrate--2-oxoglutarate transaminase [Armatimonadota bacterium]MDR7491594.1 4-aminobutyrate--2-oxoglutarate transaminase [Armatimonadota bacterium]